MNIMKLYCQDKGLRWLTGGFAPISLEELNSKAEMMSRIDNKYVVDRWALERILPALLEEFDILEIDDRRAFTYDTRYFDDPDCSAYYEHHQGLRKGFKVRVRRYSDAGLCFLEVKVKGKRGMTVKNRQSYDPADLGELTPEAFDYAKGVYTGHYDKAFDYDLRPALDIEYQRITLVAKEGGERMTIDGKLSFRNEKKRLEAPNDVFIVETKCTWPRICRQSSPRGSCAAHQEVLEILHRHGSSGGRQPLEPLHADNADAAPCHGNQARTGASRPQQCRLNG